MPSYPPTSLPPEAQASVRQYELRIIELLDSCADHQRHDPEVFLWNARRALEAICHLLLTVEKKQTSRADTAGKESSLDGLIKHLQGVGVLDKQQFPRFEMARMQTNLGVHIQKPEREDYPAAVADVAHVLVGIVDWLYTTSPATPFLQRRKDLPSELIRKGGREGPSLKEAAATERAGRERAEAALAEKERQNTELQRQLGARSKGQGSWTGGVTLGLLAGLILGACGGMLTGSFLGMGRDAPATAAVSTTAAPPSAVVLSTTPTTPTVAPPPPAAPPTPASVTPAAAIEERVPSAPPEAFSGACPAGTLIVPTAHAMRLGQPEGARPGWPRPSERAIDAVQVPAFCMDPGPRQRNTLAEGTFNQLLVVECEQRATSGLPAAQTCLTREEAEGACARELPGGHLPGMLEWEAAARGRPAGLVLPTLEWSGERFPPAPLNRSDDSWNRGDAMTVGQLLPRLLPATRDGHLLLDWQQTAPVVRDPQVGFRCAAPAR